MTPYYRSDDGVITVYCGDMRALCASLRADAVVTDAPFGIADAPLGARKGGRKGDTAPTDYHAPSDWDRDFDPAWCRAACEAAPVVAWFGSWKRRADVEAATTLVVCKALGRRCIGIDMSEEHCATAVARLRAVPRQEPAAAVGPLFAGLR